MNPWNVLVETLGGILAFFFQIIPNYGVAIILLTLLISLLLFPLTLKQTRSMKAMQEIQPEVKRLQKEYRSDREEMNKQLMALYQEKGVNPAAGCLPLLVQMPIWFALFTVLRVRDVVLGPVADGVNGAFTALGERVGTTFTEVGIGSVRSSAIPESSDLFAALADQQSGFLGMDLLTSPNGAFSDGILAALPYIILIVVVVGVQFYQQYQTTRRRSTDGEPQTQQQQSMQNAMKVLPLLSGFISWTFPAGLGLYFATSGAFRIGQQSVILRLDEREEPAAGVAVVEEPAAPPSTPSPHASKKRKGRRRK